MGSNPATPTNKINGFSKASPKKYPRSAGRQQILEKLRDLTFIVLGGSGVTAVTPACSSRAENPAALGRCLHLAA